jgi:hypothetical protein
LYKMYIWLYVMYICLFNVYMVIFLFSMSMYSYCMFMHLHRASWRPSATLTEVFPCFFLSCKANARVKTTKTGHGPHSSKIIFVLFYVLLFLCCSVCCLFLCCSVYCLFLCWSVYCLFFVVLCIVCV